ncbi:MAG: hypothetical protein ABL888_08150 [Pirellulaceae bacterium]
MSSATHRADKINKLFKVARKYHQPVEPPSNRTVIEHLLYSCCLENATFELADEVFARLQEEYFDWNEVRVTTTAELAEVMKKLPDATEASNRIRKTLHGLFEAHYSFDIEFLRKENLGKAIEQIEKYRGVSPFCVSYVSQSVLGGHSIPIDASLMLLMQVIGVVSESEAASFRVTGLERTIPKNKGIEFFSVVHQLAVAFHNNSFNKDIRAIVLEIDKDAAERFPRRGGRKKADEPVAEPEPQPAPTKGKATAPPSAAAKTAGKPNMPEKPQKPEKVDKKATAKAPSKAVDKASAKAIDKKKKAVPAPKAQLKKAKQPPAKKPAVKAAAKKTVKRKPR